MNHGTLAMEIERYTAGEGGDASEAWRIRGKRIEYWTSAITVKSSQDCADEMTEKEEM